MFHSVFKVVGYWVRICSVLSLSLETLDSEAILQLFLLVGNLVCWTDFRAFQGGEFLGVNAKVGGKIMKGMKMLEGRKSVSSPSCWSGICLQASKWIKHHNLVGRHTFLKHC